MSIRRHLVIHRGFVNGRHDGFSMDLTEAKARIRSARRYADHFYAYEITARDGTRMHVVYARFLPGSPKHGFSGFDPTLDVTYTFELTAEAVAVGFGLTSAPTTRTEPDSEDPNVFTDRERAEIEAEHDRMTADLWPLVRTLESERKSDLARRLRDLACDFEEVAEAARTSSSALSRIY